MPLEGYSADNHIQELWKEALGGEARWKMLPEGQVPLSNPLAQTSAMAYWVGTHAHERSSDMKTAFTELKREWIATMAPRFRSYLETHVKEKCDLHDETQMALLVKHVNDQALH